MRLTASQGRVVLNPRHVTRLNREDQDKRSTATGEREYCVLAHQDDSHIYRLDYPSAERAQQSKKGYTPGWGSEADADYLLSQAGYLITGTS